MGEENEENGTEANGTESDETKGSGGTGTKGEAIRLPEDHPLVTALKAQKDRNAALSAKVKEYEDADKSETEKLRDEVASGKDAATLAIRYEVALDKGLTKAQAKRLVGATREEIEADAEELATDLGIGQETKSEPKGKPSGRPTEKLRPGASDEGDPEPDYDKLADSIRGPGI